MAINAPTWVGFGKITDADTTTGFSVVDYRGAGGTPSPALADGGLQGVSAAQAITVTVSKKGIILWFDVGAGNELDFTPSTGSETDQMVYVWGNFLASGLLQPLSNVTDGSFGVAIGTDASNYNRYNFFDGSNYSGGWKRMIVDPTKTPSTAVGTINLASVRYFGVFANVGTATARFDNLLCDRIDVGTGYQIDGTSTADALFTDIITEEETTANWWGVTLALNDAKTALELNGQLTLGDNTGTLAATLTDINTKLFAAEPLYYQGGGMVPAVPLDFFKVIFAGNATGATDITLGKKVGTGDTARGRNGITIVGNSTYNLGIDFDDGNVNALKIYGSTFENCTGVLSWGTNTAHELIGSSFTECSQFDPVGGIIIRNTTFSNYSGPDAALLWNSSIDIKNCNFIANTDATNTPAGIEHTDATGSPFAYDGLIFSGNDADVLLSHATLSIIINASNGANPSIKREDGTGTITINNPKSFSFTVEPSITGYEWRIYSVTALGSLAGSVELDGEETALADNQTYNYTYTIDTPIAVQIISQPNADYEEIVRYFTLTNENQSQTINLVPDNNN